MAEGGSSNLSGPTALADRIPESNLPWVESPFFADLLAAKKLAPNDAEAVAFYHENGYLILENAVPVELADRIREETRRLFRPEIHEGPRCANRAYAAWKESAGVRRLAGHPGILSTLRLLYGRKPIPFHTVNFHYGSQRRAHCDCIHYSSLPARYLCAAWVALEDISPDSGPLFVYPGSHRLPEFTLYDIGLTVANLDYRKYEEFIEGVAAAQGFQKKSLLLRKGDAVLYASNLMHGGESIRESGKTRWSQITHYYFEDCLYYTPLHSNFLVGKLQHHEIRDVTTGAFVDQTYNGRPFAAIPTGLGRFRITEKFLGLGRTVSRIRRLFDRVRSRFSNQPLGYRG